MTIFVFVVFDSYFVSIKPVFGWYVAGMLPVCCQYVASILLVFATLLMVIGGLCNKSFAK